MLRLTGIIYVDTYSLASFTTKNILQEDAAKVGVWNLVHVLDTCTPSGSPIFGDCEIFRMQCLTGRSRSQGRWVFEGIICLQT